jgi:hypothetical protein
MPWHRQGKLPALPGHLLSAVDGVGDREAYPKNGEHQSPEDNLKDQDHSGNNSGNNEGVKEEECEHDDIV